MPAPQDDGAREALADLAGVLRAAAEITGEGVVVDEGVNVRRLRDGTFLARLEGDRVPHRVWGEAPIAEEADYWRSTMIVLPEARERQKSYLRQAKGWHAPASLPDNPGVAPLPAGWGHGWIAWFRSLEHDEQEEHVAELTKRYSPPARTMLVLAALTALLGWYLRAFRAAVPVFARWMRDLGAMVRTVLTQPIPQWIIVMTILLGVMAFIDAST